MSVQELQQQQGALLREGKASAVREEEERLVSLKAELGSHRGGDVILSSRYFRIVFIRYSVT